MERSSKGQRRALGKAWRGIHNCRATFGQEGEPEKARLLGNGSQEKKPKLTQEWPTWVGGLWTVDILFPNEKHEAKGPRATRNLLHCCGGSKPCEQEGHRNPASLGCTALSQNEHSQGILSALLPLTSAKSLPEVSKICQANKTKITGHGGCSGGRRKRKMNVKCRLTDTGCLKQMPNPIPLHLL